MDGTVKRTEITSILNPKAPHLFTAALYQQPISSSSEKTSKSFPVAPVIGSGLGLYLAGMWRQRQRYIYTRFMKPIPVLGTGLTAQNIPLDVIRRQIPSTASGNLQPHIRDIGFPPVYPRPRTGLSTIITKPTNPKFLSFARQVIGKFKRFATSPKFLKRAGAALILTGALYALDNWYHKKTAMNSGKISP